MITLRKDSLSTKMIKIVLVMSFKININNVWKYLSIIFQSLKWWNHQTLRYEQFDVLNNI
jgi:hypothetical protein